MDILRNFAYVYYCKGTSVCPPAYGHGLEGRGRSKVSSLCEEVVLVTGKRGQFEAV